MGTKPKIATPRPEGARGFLAVPPFLAISSYRKPRPSLFRYRGTVYTTIPWALITVPLRQSLHVSLLATIFGLRLPSPFCLCASVGLTPYPDSLCPALRHTSLVHCFYMITIPTIAFSCQVLMWSHIGVIPKSCLS